MTTMQMVGHLIPVALLSKNLPGSVGGNIKLSEINKEAAIQ